VSGLEARKIVEAAVRRELFGPADGDPPSGTPIDCSPGYVAFESKEASNGRFHDVATRGEILTQSDPLRRYGIGVLFAGGSTSGTTIGSSDDAEGDPDLTWVPGLADSEDAPTGPPILLSEVANPGDADTDDFDLTDANTFKPSAMAVSFKCRIRPNGSLGIVVRCAYYDKVVAHIPDVKQPRDWWVRRPFELLGQVAGDTLLAETRRLKTVATRSSGGPNRISPTVQIYSRPVPREPDPELRLVTVAVVNQTAGTGPANALFQMTFTVAAEGALMIEPYPEIERAGRDDEEQSIDLLYRNRLTYAVGHGCAAEWGETTGSEPTWIRAEPLPAHEVVSLTPNVYVRDESGTRVAITVSMAALAAGAQQGRDQVETVLSAYEQWIEQQEELIADLPARYEATARRHMSKCRDVLGRMRVGWGLVTTNAVASRAFRLANEAMLFQQIRSRLPLREVDPGDDEKLRPKGAHPTVVAQSGQGQWRPFQIAFLLATIPELVELSLPTRNVVDLIFFPTGGGKTEAYLGASAFSLLARRLRNPHDVGTDTIMRYTLRLLTAQQFLRAASLICVLEDIRSKSPTELGVEPFGIGIWLGGDSTPNTWRQAADALGRLRSDPHAQNRFLLLRCPWCGAQMGSKPRFKNGKAKGQHVFGYDPTVGGKQVALRCIDRLCRFGGRDAPLPIHIVDEDIYATRPSLIIGTVDKFAMMAWRPEARRLFGLGDGGEREVSPPGLVIQDELHLISGPLGSMVGIYEPVIEELCTDRRGPNPVVAKVIASTATIRRYEDQIRGLFGRTEVALFPPHGLEEGHSFFAEPATNPDGSPEPGRRYVGLMSASLGSMQTLQVRVTAATLLGAADVPETDRDGYWTNLNFLNSLRELGNTVSLLDSDVPDYLTGLKRRDGIVPRWPSRTMELTSRRRSDEIPRAIEQLEVRYGNEGCIDICLASNIIEVGIDISRLGLMTIVGQPKTTSQYIQVSGRVGRRPDVPGLVLTLYGAAKPRDRSHYERFRTYHERLYAQVEPTSVTPFAAPVLRRALHAAAIAHVRQVAPHVGPHPFPAVEYEAAIELLRRRAALVDPREMPNLEKHASDRAREWARWERTEWDANVIGGHPTQGLMRYSGTLPTLDSKSTIWDVPTSMRNVDAECRVKISLAYNSRDDDAAGEDE
jgi:Helicase conserved C-terminal domain